MFHEVITHMHPIVVHFPIVLIIFATLYDLFFAIFKREPAPKGNWIWFVAFLSAWITVGTGPGENARGNTNLFKYHDKLANLTTILTFLNVAYRVFFMVKRKKVVRQWLAINCILSVLCTIGILSVGYYGGKMVYDQGIGVKVHGKFVNPPKQGHSEDHD
ncbi:DUF2231 domain-containing protein [Bacillus smithii]|uniref:DUF2231 domain-containing protein n=1 Tax=Bacillus smithii TaxID=1479 RepID=UPI0030C95100